VRFFEKKYDVILQALATIKESGFHNFVFHVGGDGPDMEKLSDLARKLGLCENIVFHGYVSDQGAFFTKIDLMIVATVGTETGIAGLQAISAGVPLLGIDTARGTMNYYRQSSFTVCKSAKELATELIKLRDAELRQRYYEEILTEKQEQLDPELMLTRYSKLFGTSAEK
jgi:glycosyltransferase involved in cell wall biosynthesis